MDSLTKLNLKVQYQINGIEYPRIIQSNRGKIRLIESNAKIDLERDFAAGVYQSEASPLPGFCLGW